MMVDDIKMDELEWSVRVSNCLKEAGIETVGQLRACSEEWLLLLPNFGRKSLWEVREMLEWLGLRPLEQPKVSWPEPPGRFEARNEAIYLARQTGRTYRSIGVEHDLSCERVRQIVQKRMRMNRHMVHMAA